MAEYNRITLYDLQLASGFTGILECTGERIGVWPYSPPRLAKVA